MPFCDLKPTHPVWGTPTGSSMSPCSDLPVFQIQRVAPLEEQDSKAAVLTFPEEVRSRIKISLDDAHFACKARQERVRKALQSTQADYERAVEKAPRTEHFETITPATNSSARSSFFHSTPQDAFQGTSLPTSSSLHLVYSFLQAEGRAAIQSMAYARYPAPRFVMVIACAITGLLQHCARRTQSTISLETPITDDGLGPGLLEGHDIDVREYLQTGIGGSLNTLELYLMLFAASRRTGLRTPGLLDVLIILDNAVNANCNLTPKTMRIMLAAAIVLAAKPPQASPSEASAPVDMKVASSAFPSLNLRRLLGATLLLERAIDFQHAALRREYTVNLAKLAGQYRPAIGAYLHLVQRKPLADETAESDRTVSHDGVTAALLSPASVFRRARPRDKSRLSMQPLSECG